VGAALKVDEDLDQTEMLKLAKRASQLGPGKVRFITVPTHVPMPSEGAVDDQGTIPPHGSVLVLNTTEFEQLLAPLRPASENGDDSTPTAEVPPSQVTVAKVLNSSGRSGLAARTVDSLQELGFAGAMAMATGDVRQAATEVRYPQGQAAAAAALAAVIPGARVVPDTTGTRSGLTLVIGSSFTTVSGTGSGALAATTRTGSAGGSSGAAGPTEAGGGTGASAAQPAASPTTAAPADTSCTP
jgi:hypothetical protein